MDPRFRGDDEHGGCSRAPTRLLKQSGHYANRTGTIQTLRALPKRYKHKANSRSRISTCHSREGENAWLGLLFLGESPGTIASRRDSFVFRSNTRERIFA